jgi:uncharacterized protein DUF4430
MTGALAVAAGAGCGFGAGPASEGTATLTVTRDYGSRTLADEAEQDPSSSETVLRFLDREADVTTRYGGGFVQSIDGVAGAEAGGRRFDWFFYVNGVESSVGAAQVKVRGGDRIWWDYRDWTDAMRVPAVVGSWPEPFAQASSEDRRLPVRVECLDVRAACHLAAARLAAAGVNAGLRNGSSGSGSDALRLVVGRWSEVAQDSEVDGLRGGPSATGVFASFGRTGAGPEHLVGLDSTASPARNLGTGSGLVAALEGTGSHPTWIVTGPVAAAVRRAASALDVEALRGRYAVATPPRGAAVALPLAGGREG